MDSRWTTGHLGVILYVISGMPPFSSVRQDKPLIKDVYDGDYSFNTTRWNTVSLEAKDLIKGLMKVNTQRRLTAMEALVCPS